MSKLFDKIMAPFQSAAVPAVIEDEITQLVETSHYLHDTSIATTRPYYNFTSIDEVLPLLGLQKEPKETKHHSHKAMELQSHHDHLNGIKTFVLSAPSIEMATVFKTPPGPSNKLQLDAIIVREGNARTCLACGPEDASRECVDLFLGCFRESAQMLQNDPTGQKSHAEEGFKGHLLIAFHTLNLERILGGLEAPPAPKTP